MAKKKAKTKPAEPSPTYGEVLARYGFEDRKHFYEKKPSAWDRYRVELQPPGYVITRYQDRVTDRVITRPRGRPEDLFYDLAQLPSLKDTDTSTKPVPEYAAILTKYGFKREPNLNLRLEEKGMYVFTLPNRPGRVFEDDERVTVENYEGIEPETRSLLVYGPAIFPGSDIGPENGYYITFGDENSENGVTSGFSPTELNRDLAKYVPQILKEIHQEYRDLEKEYRRKPKS
jgi:hypothetical protein